MIAALIIVNLWLLVGIGLYRLLEKQIGMALPLMRELKHATPLMLQIVFAVIGLPLLTVIAVRGNDR